MRTLALFLAFCGVLVLLAGWLVVSTMRKPPAAETTSWAEQASADRASLRELATATDPNPAEIEETGRGPVPRREAAAQPDPVDRAPEANTPSAAAIAADLPPPVSPVRWPEEARLRTHEARLKEHLAALAIDPENAFALRGAMAAATALERWGQLRRLLGRQVALTPEDADARYEYGTLLLRLRRPVEAVAQLKAAAALRPDDPQTRYNLAVAHQSLGHLYEARQAWTEAARLMPENPDVFAHRAEVLLDLGEWEAAWEDCERALKLDSSLAEVRLNLSRAAARLGRFDEALDACRIVLDRNPTHVPALNQFARIAWEAWLAGDGSADQLRMHAADAAQRSLAIDPGQDTVRSLLESIERGH